MEATYQGREIGIEMYKRKPRRYVLCYTDTDRFKTGNYANITRILIEIVVQNFLKVVFLIFVTIMVNCCTLQGLIT